MSSPYYIESLLINSVGSTTTHGFFTRQGGVSSAEFESLNCSLSSEDATELVLENRGRVSIGLDCETLVSLKQIHSNKVIVVKSQADTNQVTEGDGMVTRERKTGLGVLGADCAAVLFADKENQIIGAAHGGWQGALTGIIDGDEPQELQETAVEALGHLPREDALPILDRTIRSHPRRDVQQQAAVAGHLRLGDVEHLVHQQRRLVTALVHLGPEQADIVVLQDLAEGREGLGEHDGTA